MKNAPNRQAAIMGERVPHWRVIADEIELIRIYQELLDFAHSQGLFWFGDWVVTNVERDLRAGFFRFLSDSDLGVGVK